MQADRPFHIDAWVVLLDHMQLGDYPTTGR